jgi:xanthine dehydrogenase accessory factor
MFARNLLGLMKFQVASLVRIATLIGMEIDLYEELLRLRRDGKKAALATIVRIRGSVPSFQTAKMLIREDGSTVGSVGGGCVEADVWAAAQDAIKEEKSRVMTFDLTDESMADSGLICGGKLEIFVEPVLPVPRAIIFGAGHISTQLSKIATTAGFKTWIVDDRPIYANETRFPEAERIFSDSFESAFSQIEPDKNTYLIIVTRGHQEDENVLRWAMETDARYIGMIGSKRKIRTIAKKLENEGIPQEQLHSAHMPIGLDIGAIVPEEIAVAIVAEMIHYRRRGTEHAESKKVFQTNQSHS